MAYAVNDLAQSAFATPAPPASAALAPGLIGSLFSTLDTVTQSQGQAAAQTALATGDTAEAGSYGTVQSIADANARLALASGEVEKAQTGLQVRKALGTQRATLAANGFSSSGNALSLLRESTRQGQLEQGIEGINATLKAGGYQQQGAAAQAEASAATAAANAATSVAATEQQIGAQSKTNATNQAAILAQMLGINVPGVSPAGSTPFASAGNLAPTLQSLAARGSGGLGQPPPAANQAAALSASTLSDALAFLGQPAGTVPTTPTTNVNASSLATDLAAFAQKQSGGGLAAQTII